MDYIELIGNYLEDLYEIKFGDKGFIIKELYNDRKWSNKRLIYLDVTLVFSRFVTKEGLSTEDLCDIWYYSKVTDLINKLPIEGLSDLKCEDIKKMIIRDGYDALLEKIANNYIESINYEPKNSKELILKLSFNDMFDSDGINDVPRDISRILEKWYFDKYVLEHLTQLLRQLVVTLGPTDWKVTWIGHGPYTLESLRMEFDMDNETGSINNKILNHYDEWFDEMKIHSTEKTFKRLLY